MPAMIIYDTEDIARRAAIRALYEHELFLRVVEVVKREPGGCRFEGYTLEFDPEAARIYANISGVILSVCCACGRTLGEKPTEGSRPGVSHGYCTRCSEEAMREVRAIRDGKRGQP